MADILFLHVDPRSLRSGPCTSFKPKTYRIVFSEYWESPIPPRVYSAPRESRLFLPETYYHCASANLSFHVAFGISIERTVVVEFIYDLNLCAQRGFSTETAYGSQAKMDSSTIHVALNAQDHLPPPNYANVILYLPLKASVTPKDVFSLLQLGLHWTFVQLPWLNGKIYPVSTTKPEVLEIRYRPVDIDGSRPYQLKFNELDTAETYEGLRESAFHPALFEEEILTWMPFLPDLTDGAEVFVAQANFMPDACILTAAACHAASDATGVFNVLRIWADNCKDVQMGKTPQTKQSPEMSDRRLLEQTLGKGGSGRILENISKTTWRLLGLEPPVDIYPIETPNGQHGFELAGPPAAISPPKMMKPFVFYISPVKVKALRDECMKELGGIPVSINDVICALIWRCLLRSRLAVRKSSSAQGENREDPGHANDMEARLDLPFDVRPYFSQSLPADYLGNCTMINQVLLPLSYLVAPSTSVALVARTIRQVAGEVTTTSLMDAYTLVKTVKTCLQLNNLKVDGNGLMVTSLLGIQFAEVCFGERLFENGGKPEAVRFLMGAATNVFRYCIALPRKSHGGIEFVANMLEEEMDLLMEDEEFGKYAMLVA